MTKSHSGMVTKGITQLATNTLTVLVIQSTFSLLQLGGYLLLITTLNRYQPRDSSKKFFYHYIKQHIYCQLWNVSGNHTVLGFNHGSLNSLNSEKPI